jgi:hypothetical protein
VSRQAVELLQLLTAVAAVAFALYRIGMRRGAPREGVAAAMAATLEWVGLTLVLYVALVAAGMAITILFRAAGVFTSMYGNTDVALIGVAAFLATAFRGWTR